MPKLLTCLFISVLFATIINAQVETKKIPQWVTQTNFSLTPNIDELSVEQGKINLLLDKQIKEPTQEIYKRFVLKIINNTGVQGASGIEAEYDPTYQKLIFHDIKIIRDGKTINKLQPKHFQLVRRELDAENYLYDGSLTAMYNISDVRSGDIIDYSYSVIGFNPIHNDSFSGVLYLNDNIPVGKVSNRLLTNKKLKFKYYNHDKAPTITLKYGLKDYLWTTTTPAPIEYENNTPSWKMLYQMVFFSSYETWEDVIKWSTDVFAVKERISPELQEKINTIKSTHKTKGERIKATLNFVQNDIRYLGLEYGISSYKPFYPNQVFNQRYGDCKDKSLLLVTMLNQMQVKAYPVLVNTDFKHTMAEIVPSPKFFDHCVVMVETANDKKIWYDPTITNQGGTYDTTYFPNYEYGLVVRKGNTSLDQFFPEVENTIITTDEFFIESIGKGATLNVTTTYRNGEADYMRRYFKNNSLKSITKEYESFYSNYYYNISATKTPRYEDDIKTNTLTTFESYKIDSLWVPMERQKNHIEANFSAPSIVNNLYFPKSDNRKHEISLEYPITRKHNITLHLPTAWNISNDKKEIKSPAFYYKWDVNYDKKEHIISINHTLKTQSHYISPKKGFERYKRDLDKLDNSYGYYLSTPKDYEGNDVNYKDSSDAFKAITNFFKNTFMFIFYVTIAIALVLLGSWYFSSRK